MPRKRRRVSRGIRLRGVRKTIRLNAVIVSVNFGDFLETTLPQNRQFLDDVVVVTSPEDERTQKIAGEWNCQVVTTKAFEWEHGFNKGRAINAGLKVLREKDWLCLLDADIVFPPGFLYYLTRSIRNAPGTLFPRRHLDSGVVYGLHRLMCPDLDQWQTFLKTGQQVWKFDKIRGSRQIPAGYFQLWNSKYSKHIRYPENYPYPLDCKPKGHGYHGDLEFIRSTFKCWVHLTFPLLIHLPGSFNYTERVSKTWGV